MKIIEVVIGNDLNEENEAIFNEFKDEFAEYIVMQSGPQTVLLGENFFANEEEITERMRVWLGSKGIDENSWGLQ